MPESNGLGRRLHAGRPAVEAQNCKWNGNLIRCSVSVRARVRAPASQPRAWLGAREALASPRSDPGTVGEGCGRPARQEESRAYERGSIGWREGKPSLSSDKDHEQAFAPSVQ